LCTLGKSNLPANSRAVVFVDYQLGARGDEKLRLAQWLQGFIPITQDDFALGFSIVIRFLGFCGQRVSEMERESPNANLQQQVRTSVWLRV
jgi:hypothetical protein